MAGVGFCPPEGRPHDHAEGRHRAHHAQMGRSRASSDRRGAAGFPGHLVTATLKLFQEWSRVRSFGDVRFTAEWPQGRSNRCLYRKFRFHTPDFRKIEKRTARSLKRQECSRTKYDGDGTTSPFRRDKARAITPASLVRPLGFDYVRI
jgi:hypothetical protein